MSRLRTALCVLLVACLTAACGSLELRPDEVSAAEWRPAEKLPLNASDRGFKWISGGIRLECGGRSNFDPSEFPVIWHVQNASSEPVTIRICRAVSDGSAVIGEGGWRGRGEFSLSIVDGEPFTLPVSSGGDLLRLRADRVWTPEEPMRDGDTVSYDVEITSAAGTETCRLRMVIARRWSDEFDAWWQPIALVPVVLVGIPVYAFMYIVFGGRPPL